MADLKIKVSAETTAAEKQIKESFRSQTEAAKRQIAVQVAEYKKGLNERKAADKQIADLVKSQTKLAEKQVTDSLKSQTDASKRQIAIQTAEYKRGLAEKKAAEKQYLDSITASYKVHQKEIAAQQKAMNKKGSGGIFGGNLEFAENLTVVTAGLAAVTAGVISLGKELFETAQAGADFGILLQSFGKAGGDEAKLALLDIAAAGNLTERELITFSLQMKQVGVSVEQTTTFLRLIEQQADNTAFTFENANDAVNSFIATGATKKLKNFLSLPELKDEVEKLNQSFIDSQGELTNEQAEINRTNAIMNVLNRTVQLGTGDLKDNADKVATVSTRIANLKDRFSLAVSEGIVPFIDNMEDIDFAELIKSVSESVIAIGKFIKVMSDIGGGIQTVIFSLAKIVTAYDLISNSIQFAIDKTKELLNLRKSAEKSEQIYQFEYSTNDEIQYDRYGNPIAPKPVLAENTMFKAGKNLGETGDSGTGSNKANKDKIDKAIIDGLEQQIKNLFETTLTPIESADRIKFLMGTKIAEFSAATVTGSENVRNPLGISPVNEDLAAQRELLLSTLSEAGNNLKSIMDTFGIKTETVLGQAVEKFQMILNLIQNVLGLIQTVGTVSSVIKTIVTGGVGRPAPLINPSGVGSGGNTFFKVDLNTMAIVRDGQPKYNEYKGAIRV